MTVLRGKRKFIVLFKQIQIYKGVYSSHGKDLCLFSDEQLHLIYIFLEMKNKNSLWTLIELTLNFVFPKQINQVPFMEYVFHTDQAQIYSVVQHWFCISLTGGVHIGARVLLDIKLIWFGYIARLFQQRGGNLLG